MSPLYLITGASSGIGFAIAKALLNSGASVIGLARTRSDKVQSLQNDYPERFIFEARDLTADLDELPGWVLGLAKAHGRFSGCVHAAGVSQILPLSVNTQQKMLEVFTLNVFAGLALARGIADKRVYAESGASIVFISSIAAKAGSSGLVNYSASKAALNGAMRAMAKEVAHLGIRVNSVLPGFVPTELADKWPDVYNAAYIEKLERLYPLGLGEAEDVAESVVFLLSEKAKWITGTELVVDGGISLGSQE